MENPKPAQWQISDALKLFADGVTLAYHEARNVRHIIKDHYEPQDGYERLVNLPANRLKAWEALQTTRKTARDLSTADKVLQVFQKRFDCDLADLERLYRHPKWEDAKGYGGHAWIRVTQLLLSLRDALSNSDRAAIAAVCDALLQARHNNGTLRGKIRDLDTYASITTDSWW